MQKAKHAKSKSRVLAMVLSATLALTPAAAFGASIDTSGHWAENVISRWQDGGLIAGYNDGSFKPDKAITRAEFSRLMNQSLDLTETGEVSFSDVTAADWFYNDVAIAVGEGYTAGYPDGTFQPNATITRAQAAVFVATAMGLTGGDVSGYPDAASIPAWALTSVAAMVEAGYLSGYTDGSLKPNAPLTRAETVSILDRAMGNAPTEEEESEDTIIDKNDTVMENEVIEGDLYVSEAIGNGKATIKDSEIKGDLIIQGGGNNSVYLENTIVKGKIVMDKKNVRLQISGEQDYSAIEILKQCTLVEKNYKGTIDTISIIEAISDKISIAVPANELLIDQKAVVELTKDIDTVTVSSDAKDTKFEVTNGVTVDDLIADARMAITGSGKILRLEANENGITVSTSTKVNKTEVADGVTKPTSGNSGGGGGGGSSDSSSSSSTRKVTGVSIDQASPTVEVGKSTTLSATITPANASNKTLTWTSSDTSVATVSTTGVVEGVKEGSADITAKSINGITDKVAVTVTKAADKPTPPTPKPEPPADNDATALVEAIENNDGTPIVLQGDILADVKATYVGTADLTINLNGHSLGNIDITADSASKVDFIDEAVTKTRAAGKGKIKGLKVKAAKAKVTTSSSVTITTVTVDVKEVVANGTIETITVETATSTTSTTISGSGTVTKVDAKTATTVSATKVTEVVASAPVEIKADVTTVSVPAGTSAENAKVTIAANTTVTTIETATSVTIEGKGTTTTVAVTTTSATTITVNGAAKVDKVESSSAAGSATVPKIEGNTTETKPTVVTVTEVTLVGTPKASYTVGDKFDVNGLTLTVTYSDNTTKEKVPVTTSMVTGFDSSKVATNQPVTISYAGVSATPFNVNIVAATITGIAVKQGTFKVNYNVGDKIDLTNSKIIVTYNNGTTEEVAVTDTMVSGFSSTAVVATQTVTITYKEATTTYTVTISTLKLALNGVVTVGTVENGKTIGDATITGNVVVSGTTTPVAGTFAWDEEAATVLTKTGSHVWTFTPSATPEKYGALKGSATIVVTDKAKDTPVAGSVTATAVSIGDALSTSTLSGAFTVGETTVAGTLTWENGATIVTATGSYKWVFTPTDATNYNVVTGTVTVTANKAVIAAPSAKVEITSKFLVGNPVSNTNVKAGAIAGATASVVVSKATKTDTTWAAGDVPTAVITYTPAADKTFTGSGFTAANFTAEGATPTPVVVINADGTMTVTVTYPALAYSNTQKLQVARNAIEAKTYEIPAGSQTDQATKTAWVQTEVTAAIPADNGTTAKVAFADGKYTVTLTCGEATGTASITVTLEIPATLTEAKTKAEAALKEFAAKITTGTTTTEAVIAAVTTAINNTNIKVTASNAEGGAELKITNAQVGMNGSINGTLTLTLEGGATLDVAVGLTIPELPTPGTSDADLVAAEKTKYETTATILKTVTAGTDVTSTVKKLVADATANPEVTTTVTAVGEDGLLELVEGVVKLKAPLASTATDNTTTVTLTVKKGDATDTVTVTVTIEKQATAQSTDATLSALKYKVGNEEAKEVTGFAATTDTYNVVLPAETLQTATITLEGTVADTGKATIAAADNTGVTLADGKGKATIKVTAEDKTTTKTYTVNFTIASSTDTAVTATASVLTTATGKTTITLNPAITGLAAGDIVVKKGTDATLTSGTDYTLGALTGTSIDVTFTATAALDSESVITITISKTGYIINEGNAITVENKIPAVISIPAIAGVTKPATGGTPVKTITETEQYAGTVTWSPVIANEGKFAANETYTATIVLTPKTGYTLTGLAENFFTVTGATEVATTIAEGNATATVTAKFAATGAATPETYTVNKPTAVTTKGVTAAAVVSKTTGVAANEDIEVTVTLSGTATEAGAYTIKLTSATDITTGITVKDSGSATHTLAAAVVPDATTTVFTFTMPAKAVTDLTLALTYAATTVPDLTGVNAEAVTGDTAKTKITGLPAVSETGNTFVYKISDTDAAVEKPAVGATLTDWTAVVNNDLITVANGKNIGIAEVTSAKVVVKFANVVAQVTPDTVIDPTQGQTVALALAANVAIGNTMADTDVTAGAIDGIAATVVVTGATGTDSKWAAGDTPAATITYTAGAGKTFTGSTWAAANFTGTGVTVEAPAPEGKTLTVKVTFAALAAADFELAAPTAAYDSSTDTLVITSSTLEASGFEADLTKIKLGTTAVTGTKTFGAGNVTIAVTNATAIEALTGFTTNGTATDGLALEAGAFTKTAGGSSQVVAATDVTVTGYTAVLLAEGSEGTAGSETITGLTANTKYKITVGTGAAAKTYAVTSAGTVATDVLTDDTTIEALAGTEITGLTNGETYKVEEVTATNFEIVSPTATYNSSTDTLVISSTTLTETGYTAELTKIKLGGTAVEVASGSTPAFEAGKVTITLSNAEAIEAIEGFTADGTATGDLTLEAEAFTKTADGSKSQAATAKVDVSGYDTVIASTEQTITLTSTAAIGGTMANTDVTAGPITGSEVAVEVTGASGAESKWAEGNTPAATITYTAATGKTFASTWADANFTGTGATVKSVTPAGDKLTVTVEFVALTATP